MEKTKIADLQFRIAMLKSRIEAIASLIQTKQMQIAYERFATALKDVSFHLEIGKLNKLMVDIDDEGPCVHIMSDQHSKLRFDLPQLVTDDLWIMPELEIEFTLSPHAYDKENGPFPAILFKVIDLPQCGFDRLGEVVMSYKYLSDVIEDMVREMFPIGAELCKEIEFFAIEKHELEMELKALKQGEVE